jgi:hypothetical protein
VAIFSSIKAKLGGVLTLTFVKFTQKIELIAGQIIALT